MGYCHHFCIKTLKSFFSDLLQMLLCSLAAPLALRNTPTSLCFYFVPLFASLIAAAVYKQTERKKKITNQSCCFHYVPPFISMDEKKRIKARLCSVNLERLLHWLAHYAVIHSHKSTEVTLMPKLRYTDRLWGMWSSMWLMKINAKVI